MWRNEVSVRATLAQQSVIARQGNGDTLKRIFVTKNQSAEARKKYLPAMTLMDEFGIGTGLAVWEQEGRVPDITWIPDWHVVME